MKKVFLGVMVCGLVLASGVTVFAMGHHGNGMGYGRYYVDANGDGICDNYASGTGYGRYYVDANGDGVCDNYASGMGYGRYYVDANGDGVCDNYGSGLAVGCHGNGCNRG